MPNLRRRPRRWRAGGARRSSLARPAPASHPRRPGCSPSGFRGCAPAPSRSLGTPSQGRSRSP
eukprot:13332241-Alexandrium_andersonii.AAC.1